MRPSTPPRLRKPDVIFASVVGGSNVAFYRQLKAAGLDMTKEDFTLLTISVTEDEILGIGGDNIQGAYASMKYFQSLDNPNNEASSEGTLVLVTGSRPGRGSAPSVLRSRRPP